LTSKSAQGVGGHNLKNIGKSKERGASEKGQFPKRDGQNNLAPKGREANKIPRAGEGLITLKPSEKFISPGNRQ